MNKMNEIKLFDEGGTDIAPAALSAMVGMIQAKDFQTIEKSQNFQVMLNQNPPTKWIKQHPYVSVQIAGKRVPYQYVPVERCELLLNKLFFGQWSTINFKWSQVFNEISGSIDLIVVDPVTGHSITRTGAAAIQIMQDQGTKVADFNTNKKANALETGFPKLKSECFKNACKSFGNVFGGNLSRDSNIVYTPLINEDNKHAVLGAILDETEVKQ